MKRRSFLTTASAALAGLSLPIHAANARSAASDISVRWLGGATMEIDLGGFRILTDPCFGEGPEAFVMGNPNEMFDMSKGPNIVPHARLTPFPGLTHESYDVILVSHAHEDHLDKAAQAWIKQSVPMICAAHDGDALQAKGFATQPLQHGDTRVFVKDDVRVSITATPAIHSENTAISDVLGQGNGYWIGVERQGKSMNLYWAGDTFMVEPLAQFLSQRVTPDLTIAHIGNVGVNGALGQLSMDGTQLAEFTARSGANRILPIHHSTYSLYQESIDDAVVAFEGSAQSEKLTLLQEGHRLIL